MSLPQNNLTIFNKRTIKLIILFQMNVNGIYFSNNMLIQIGAQKRINKYNHLIPFLNVNIRPKFSRSAFRKKY